MRQSASLTAGSRDASSTGDRRAAHTPGPWVVRWFNDGHAFVYDADHSVVANVITGDPEGEANASLMAAAPYMLAALRVVLAITEDFLTDPTQHQDHILIALDGVRAAIALSDHQNAPTDDTTGQRSGLSP